MNTSFNSFILICLFLFQFSCGFAQTEQDTGIKVIEAHSPQYPTLALLSKIEGLVIIKVLIDEKGRVRNADVAEGHKLLLEMSMKTAEKWLFNTGCGGRKIELIFVYKIIPKDSNDPDYSVVFHPPNKVTVYKKNPLPYKEIAPPLYLDPIKK